MSGEYDKISEEYFNLMSGLAESTLDMTPEEISEEIAENGDTAEETRAMFANAIRFAKQQALREAKREHEQAVLTYEKINFAKPETPAEKRGLIQTIIEGLKATQPEVLTAQFRDFEGLPDDDLDTLLDQLHFLEQQVTKGE